MGRLSEDELRAALRRTPVDSDARERSWQVLARAVPDAPVRRRRPRRVVLPLALVAALAVAVPVAAGEQALQLFREGLGLAPRPPAAQPVLGPLPGGGRLLVTGTGSAWVVARDGARRRLGSYDGAAWSPRGLFVVAWSGGRLSAVTPDGGVVRWTLTRPSPVREAEWAPGDGYRIAYSTRADLRVVNGDGTGDRRIAAPTSDFAWRPGAAGHVLAYATGGGRVRVVDVDARAVRWSAPAGGRVRALAWSADGQRLLVVRDRRIALHDARGRLLASRRQDGAAVAAWSPRGDRLALVRGTQVVLLDRSLRPQGVAFGAPGPVGDPAWSPDGRHLLIPWPGGDQWIVVGGGRARALTGMRREFRAGPRPEPGFPGSVRWCC